MKELQLPYQMVKPPKAVSKAQLDNLALVPASLLAKKGRYQRMANHLPRGGVLICQTEQKQRIRAILEQVAAFFKEHGHFVRVLPYSMLA